MIKPKTAIRRWTVLIALAMAALACNMAGLGADDGAEPGGDALTEPAAGAEATTAPTTAPEPTEAPTEPAADETSADDADTTEAEATPGKTGDAPGDALETLDFEGLLYAFDDQLVGEWTYEYEGDAPQDQTLPLYIAGVLRVQRDPLVVALDYTDFEVSGDAGMMAAVSADDMRFMAESDRFYMTFSGQCIAFDVQDEDEGENEKTTAAIVNPLDFISSESRIELSLVGEEDVNGVTATHYRAENVAYSGFENATIDIWYASDEGYIPRIVISGNLTAYQAEGTTTITYNLAPAEQPEELVPPENCQSFAIPGG